MKKRPRTQEESLIVSYLQKTTLFVNDLIEIVEQFLCFRLSLQPKLVGQLPRVRYSAIDCFNNQQQYLSPALSCDKNIKSSEIPNSCKPLFSLYDRYDAGDEYFGVVPQKNALYSWSHDLRLRMGSKVHQICGLNHRQPTQYSRESRVPYIIAMDESTLESVAAHKMTKKTKNQGVFFFFLMRTGHIEVKHVDCGGLTKKTKKENASSWGYIQQAHQRPLPFILNTEYDHMMVDGWVAVCHPTSGIQPPDLSAPWLTLGGTEPKSIQPDADGKQYISIYRLGIQKLHSEKPQVVARWVCTHLVDLNIFSWTLSQKVLYLWHTSIETESEYAEIRSLDAQTGDLLGHHQIKLPDQGISNFKRKTLRIQALPNFKGIFVQFRQFYGLFL
jgi:hypothetical protein